MNIPGFTADAALHSRHIRYAATGGAVPHSGSLDGSIIPAALPEFLLCYLACRLLGGDHFGCVGFCGGLLFLPF